MSVIDSEADYDVERNRILRSLIFSRLQKHHTDLMVAHGIDPDEFAADAPKPDNPYLVERRKDRAPDSGRRRRIGEDEDSVLRGGKVRRNRA